MVELMASGTERTLRTEPEVQITYLPRCCYFIPQRWHNRREEQQQLSTKCPSICAHVVTLLSKQKLSPYQVFNVIQSIFYINKMFPLIYFLFIFKQGTLKNYMQISKVLSLSTFVPITQTCWRKQPSCNGKVHKMWQFTTHMTVYTSFYYKSPGISRSGIFQKCCQDY